MTQSDALTFRGRQGPLKSSLSATPPAPGWSATGSWARQSRRLSPGCPPDTESTCPESSTSRFKSQETIIESQDTTGSRYLSLFQCYTYSVSNRSQNGPKIFLLFSLFLLLATLVINFLLNRKIGIISLTPSSDSSNYTGSLYKDNYVWGGAMNLAWTELSQSIVKDKIQLVSSDPKTQDIVLKLNNPVLSTADLDAASYYIKSGYGQGTVNTINTETKAKFPSKSFPDLDLKLNEEDIIAYAYLLKEVEYEVAFSPQIVNFLSSPVKGFVAKNNQQKNNITILSYDSDDKFILSLRLKDSADQLILAKGYDTTSPASVLQALRSSPSTGQGLSSGDIFQAPKLSLNASRKYTELVEKFFSNKGFEKYFIKYMFENIKFNMDEKGARVENEAVIVGSKTSIEGPPPKIKVLKLDKPYWVIMKRTSSPNPYFLLGLNNTELMTSALSP